MYSIHFLVFLNLKIAKAVFISLFYGQYSRNVHLKIGACPIHSKPLKPLFYQLSRRKVFNSDNFLPLFQLFQLFLSLFNHEEVNGIVVNHSINGEQLENTTTVPLSCK